MKYHVNVARHRSIPDTVILFQGGETSPAQEDGRLYIHTSDAAGVAAQLTHFSDPARPGIVCLCGSTRFSEAFRRANLYETLAEHIVLTIGADFKSDDALGLDEEDKARLDRLHLHKVGMADTVLILNIGDYIGSSTRNELRHAIQQQKRIRFIGSHRCGEECPCYLAHFTEEQPFPIVCWDGGAYFDLCNEVCNQHTAYGQPIADMRARPLDGDMHGLIACDVDFGGGRIQTFCFDTRPQAEREAAAEHAEEVPS